MAAEDDLVVRLAMSRGLVTPAQVSASRGELLTLRTLAPGAPWPALEAEEIGRAHV